MHGQLWKKATQGKARPHPSTAQPGSNCAVLPRALRAPLLPGSLTAQSVEPKAGGGKHQVPPRIHGAELSPCREASRRLVPSCRRSLNSITLSFGPTCERNSQQYHTFPQGSKHYLDERMI